MVSGNGKMKDFGLDVEVMKEISNIISDGRTIGIQKVGRKSKGGGNLNAGSN